MNFKVTGSDISLICDTLTGSVLSARGNSFSINKVDVKEYLSHYSLSYMPHRVDILTIGYWYGEGDYCPPEETYREELLLPIKNKTIKEWWMKDALFKTECRLEKQHGITQKMIDFYEGRLYQKEVEDPTEHND